MKLENMGLSSRVMGVRAQSARIGENRISLGAQSVKIAWTQSAQTPEHSGLMVSKLRSETVWNPNIGDRREPCLRNLSESDMITGL